MEVERIKNDDAQLRALTAVGGFVADPFNRRWHVASCARVARMTTGEVKWYAADRASLEAYLGEREAAFRTAEPLRPCEMCTPERTDSMRSVGHHAPNRFERPDLGASSAQRSWWIAGRPASFATAGERDWKGAVAAALPACEAPHAEMALDVAFSLGAAQVGRNEPDLDNLLEPLLSVVVNVRRWFTGGRPAIMAIAATKRHDEPTGARISIADAVSEPWPHHAAGDKRVFHYPGPLPTSARDPVLAQWLLQVGVQPLDPGPVGLGISFGSAINLGDIATGPVKTTIDGLWPILGGRPGEPDDRRVGALLIRRSLADAPAGGASITIRLTQPPT